WEYLACIIHALWVIDSDRSPSEGQRTSYRKRGRVTHIIRIRLKSTPQHGDAMSQQGPVEGTLGEVHHAVAPTHVDRVDLAQKCQILFRAVHGCTCYKNMNFSRLTTLAKALAGKQKLAITVFILANSIFESYDVAIGDLTNFCD